VHVHTVIPNKSRLDNVVVFSRLFSFCEIEANAIKVVKGYAFFVGGFWMVFKRTGCNLKLHI